MKSHLKHVAATALLMILAWGNPATAAESNKAQVGQPAPDFELQSVREGDAHKLSDYQGEKVVVLTWQSIHCPWNYYREGAGYEQVLYPLSKQYADKDVVFLAINSNHNESIEELKSYAEEHQTPYPILKDPSNQVADLYDAQTTPHFFVIDKEGVLRYAGGFEKVPTSPDVTGEMDEPYLVPVLDALLAGEELPQTQTASKGCRIYRE